MSFELTNASTTFQTYINNVLKKYLDKFVIVYLNDILIYFKTKKKFLFHVRKVLEAMKRVNLRVKLEKSEFYQKEVKFLDHILFSTRIRSNSKKLKVILNLIDTQEVRENTIFCEINELRSKVRKNILNYREVFN